MEQSRQSIMTTRATLDSINQNLKNEIEKLLNLNLIIEGKDENYLTFDDLKNDFDIVKDIHNRINNSIKRKNSIVYAQEVTRKRLEATTPVIVTKEEFAKMFFEKYFYQNEVDFQIDKNNSEIFNLLMQYFMNDPEFEKDGRSLNKGLCLIGSYGCGKTSMMRAFQNNPKQHYITVYVPKIFNDYKAAKESEKQMIISHFTDYSKMQTIQNHFKHNKSGVCFDDPLKEINANNFGENRNIFREIILSRYDQKTSFKGLTHMTTNATAPQLTEKYGGDFVDRMKEMFNVIVFPEQESRRG